MKNTCFAAQRNGCKILELDRCPVNCSFRKTVAQFDLDALASMGHLATLPLCKQRAISKKYFNGNKPWLNFVEVKKHAR